MLRRSRFTLFLLAHLVACEHEAGEVEASGPSSLRAPLDTPADGAEVPRDPSITLVTEQATYDNLASFTFVWTLEPAGHAYDRVGISYSLDRGAKWTVIATDQPVGTPYVWASPGVHGPHILFRLRATGPQGTPPIEHTTQVGDYLLIDEGKATTDEVYYVDARRGRDSWNGQTPATAWRGLRYALVQLQTRAGAVLLVRDAACAANETACDGSVSGAYADGDVFLAVPRATNGMPTVVNETLTVPTVVRNYLRERPLRKVGFSIGGAGGVAHAWTATPVGEGQGQYHELLLTKATLGFDPPGQVSSLTVLPPGGEPLRIARYECRDDLTAIEERTTRVPLPDECDRDLAPGHFCMATPAQCGTNPKCHVASPAARTFLLEGLRETGRCFHAALAKLDQNAHPTRIDDNELNDAQIAALGDALNRNDGLVKLGDTYMGPGYHYEVVDGVGHLLVRLDQPAADVFCDKNGVCDLEFNEKIEDLLNPIARPLAELVLDVSYGDNGLRLGSNGNSVAALDNVVIRGLRFEGFNNAIRIYDSTDLVLRDLELVGNKNGLVLENCRYDGLCQTNLLIDGMHLDGMFPPWIAWGDVKQGMPGVNVFKMGAMKIGALGLNSADMPAWVAPDAGPDGITIVRSSFVNVFDGLIASAPSLHWVVHSNTFDVVDDAFQVVKDVHHVDFGGNYVRGPAMSRENTEDQRFACDVATVYATDVNCTDASDAPCVDHVGKKYIHHNVIAPARKRVFWGREWVGMRNPKATGVAAHQPFPWHLGSEGDQVEPWKIYNNTVIYDDPAGPATGPGISGVGRGDIYAACLPNQKHEIYNNIFIQLADLPLIDGVDPRKDAFGGNLWSRAPGSSALVLCEAPVASLWTLEDWRALLGAGVTGEVGAQVTLDAFDYPIGLDTDPVLSTGAVAVPDAWPGLALPPSAPHRGALPTNGVRVQSLRLSGPWLDHELPIDGVLSASQSSRTTVDLMWWGFSDPGSGIASYTLVSDTTPPDCSQSLPLLTGPPPLEAFTHGGLSDGVHYYRLCATDGVGKVSVGATASVQFDATAPVGAVAIDGGAVSTASTRVTLALSANEAAEGGVRMCISSSAVCPDDAWEPFAATRPWTLEAGEGTRTVNAWFRDRWGNTSSVFQDDIFLDRTGPTGTIVINDNARFANGTSPMKLSLDARDVSGSSHVCIRSTPASCAPSEWVPYTATTYRAPTTTTSPRSVYATFRDALGNVGATVFDQILVDVTPPSIGSLSATPSIRDGAPELTLTYSGISDSGAGVATHRVVWAVGTAPPTCAQGTVLHDGAPLTSYVHRGIAEAVTYGYRLCATDQVGNTALGATASRRSPDVTGPVGSITIAGGADLTRTPAVVLSLQASDASRITQVCVSDSPSCTSWRSLGADIPRPLDMQWTLPAGEGAHRVYARFKDEHGNLGAQASDDIVLDTIGPTAPWVIIDGGLPYTRAVELVDGVLVARVAIALGANEPEPDGIHQMCYSSALPCTRWTPYASAVGGVELRVAAGDVATVYVQFRDRVGNLSLVATDTIKPDVLAPTPGVLSATASRGQVELGVVGIVDNQSGVAAYTLVYAEGAPPPDCASGTRLAESAAPFTRLTHLDVPEGVVLGYRLCAADVAGNVTLGTTAQVSTYERVAPTAGSVLINLGATYATLRTVTLTLAARDTTTVSQVCISNSSTCSSWEMVLALPLDGTHVTTRPGWTLPSGTGARPVTVWFRDPWGNTSAPASATIFLDGVAPATGTLVATRRGSNVELEARGFSDVGSGIDRYVVRYSTVLTPAPYCVGGQELPTSGATAKHDAPSQGRYLYRACAVDRAGNVAYGATVTIAVP